LQKDFSTIFAQIAPNLTPDKFLGNFSKVPLDIERMNPPMWRGSAHHGASNAAQSGGCPRARMGAIPHANPGLYQTGACTAPGGSITGLPGRNAATVMLKTLGPALRSGPQERDKAS